VLVTTSKAFFETPTRNAGNGRSINEELKLLVMCSDVLVDGSLDCTLWMRCYPLLRKV
jgi:hypothetical protein